MRKLLLPWLLLDSLAADLAAQAASGEPPIAASLATLEEVMRDPGAARDAEGVVALGELGAAYAELDKAERKKAVTAVASVLAKGKLRLPEQPELYKAAAAALAKMGEAGARQLVKAFEAKRFPNKEEWAPMRAWLVRCIGDTKDPGMIEFLCDQVSRSIYDEVLVAVGEAAASYADLDQRQRAPLVKAMIGKIGELEAAASMAVLRADTPQQLSTQNAKETLDKIAGPWNQSLRQLTQQSFENGTDWQRWYNKNKDKKWTSETER